eukprot:TRINITY_DN533_c0_g5_i2.p1 TRINITY_DN533_c0_g5~~TRINITY_DN533_c0_g5_i2.p1  ORF type:complete len:753 (+),score=291.19 TRINITY_DN533_c0_g5_i2:140-2260(+)
MGHYYAYIKSPNDKKWYNFNDETVTLVTKENIMDEVMSANSRSQVFSGWSSTYGYGKSATPYMLIYRKATAENEMAPIPQTEIPSPILDLLSKEEAKRAEKRIQVENEKKMCTISILRNQLGLPIKKIKISKFSTFREFREEVARSIANEGNENQIYRFRRVATRKNSTQRPMNLLKEDDDATLEKLGFDKKTLYLEQIDASDTDAISELEVFGDEYAFMSIRTWDEELRRPKTIRDFVFPKSTTLAEVCEVLAKFLPYSAEEMIVHEEETPGKVNLLSHMSYTLSNYHLISGDILHVEPRRSDGTSYIVNYLLEKEHLWTFTITETKTSWNRRNAKFQKNLANSATSDTVKSPTVPKSKKQKIPLNSAKILLNKNRTLGELKTILSLKFRIPENYLRIYHDQSGYLEDGKLLKDLDATLEHLLKNSWKDKKDAELGMEILEEPEELKKGEMVFKCRCFHDKESLTVPIKIPKTSTFKDIKLYLSERLGISPELMVLSEWYNEGFFKLYSKDQDLVKVSLRPADILRMDVVPHPSLNITNPDVLALQLVKYVEWEQSTFGRKMQTSWPSLLTVPLTINLLEFRQIISSKVNVPAHNLNWGAASSLPVHDRDLSLLKKILEERKVAPYLQLGDSQEPDLQVEEMTKLAEAENRDKTTHFHLEKKIPFKALQLRPLSVIVYDDLREPFQKNKIASKKGGSDSDILKIM